MTALQSPMISSRFSSVCRAPPGTAPLSAARTEMGRGTPALSFELGVALPYRPFVFAVGVPDLRSEVFAAISAFQLCRERAAAVMAPPRVLPPLYFHLYELLLRRLDDGVMATLHLILRRTVSGIPSAPLFTDCFIYLSADIFIF